MTTPTVPIIQQPQQPNRSVAMWVYLTDIIVSIIALCLPFLLLLLWVPPLIFRSAYPDDPFVQNHAANVLNNGLTALIRFAVAGIGILLCLTGYGAILGIPLILAALASGIGGWVCAILGAVKANASEKFVFPVWVAFRFVHTK
jgi:uncharacterized Tic20 family protein